jgi:hypothetical protein
MMAQQHKSITGHNDQFMGGACKPRGLPLREIGAGPAHPVTFKVFIFEWMQ